MLLMAQTITSSKYITVYNTESQIVRLFSCEYCKSKTTVIRKLHCHNYDLKRSQLKPCCPRTKCTIQFGYEINRNISHKYQGSC